MALLIARCSRSGRQTVGITTATEGTELMSSRPAVDHLRHRYLLASTPSFDDHRDYSECQNISVSAFPSYFAGSIRGPWRQAAPTVSGRSPRAKCFRPG